jgi:CheY-like chemotaxis protein
MGELELARALKRRRQDAKVLMLTGYSPDHEIKDTAPKGVVGWVQKPPQMEQLAQVAAQALSTD